MIEPATSGPNRWTGLVAAAFTPFREDRSLDTSVVEKQAELFVASGVSGVFACGTSGECHSLTQGERLDLAQSWVRVAGKDLRVFVHVGSNCLEDARALAAHAQEQGAAAIAAMAPFFFRPVDVDGLVEYCAAIAAAAPDLPFYYYHIPDLTGVSLPMAAFLERGAEKIPTLAGVKFTSSDLHAFQECVALQNGRFDLLFGRDEYLLAALVLGAKGAIGSTYNFAAPVYHRVVEAFAAGDTKRAQAEQQKSVELVRSLFAYGVLPGCKAIMKLMGLDCGPCRPPLPVLTKEQLREIYAAIHDLDIFARPLVAPG